MQKGTHGQGDGAHWVAIWIAGVLEKMHGGSNSAAWPREDTAIVTEKERQLCTSSLQRCLSIKGAVVLEEKK